jgi:hypothetical protein
MKHLASLSEVVECWVGSEGVFEVIATAEATYCESRKALLVQLDVTLRPLNFDPDEDFLSASWVPHRDTSLEIVQEPQAKATCDRVFKAWIAKVRAAIPSAEGLGRQ